VFKNILSISQYPNIQPDTNESFADRLTTLFKAYGYVWLAIIAVAAPVVSLTDVFVTHVLHFKSIIQVDKTTLKEMLEKTGYVFGMLYICLIGPVLEETVFRLPLSFKRNHIALSFTIIVFFSEKFLPAPTAFIFSIRICYDVLRLLIPFAVYFITRKLLPAEINLSDKTKQKLIITSMCLFGLMHVSNYAPLQWPIIWIYPVYVLPQFFMGWLMTYVRLKNGFLWGVALHCMINSTSMLLSPEYRQQEKPKPAHTVTTKKDSVSTRYHKQS